MVAIACKVQYLLWWVSPWLVARPPLSRSLTPLPQQDGAWGRNKMKKFTGQDKDREITYQLPSRSKQT